jgi:hypothetical protein
MQVTAINVTPIDGLEEKKPTRYRCKHGVELWFKREQKTSSTRPFGTTSALNLRSNTNCVTQKTGPQWDHEVIWQTEDSDSTPSLTLYSTVVAVFTICYKTKYLILSTFLMAIKSNRQLLS